MRCSGKYLVADAHQVTYNNSFVWTQEDYSFRYIMAVYAVK